MHKYPKRIVAGLLTAAMIVPVTVSLAEPLCASAYELLGETDFDRKIFPWHTVEVSPAKQTFDCDECSSHIQILVPTGGERASWDLQFVHNGLEFKAGHEYKVTFHAKASREGLELISHISSNDGYKQYFELDGATNDMHMGPDMGGTWGRCVQLTEKYQEFSGVFVPTENIAAAKWVFYYAHDDHSYGGNAVQGDEIWFDEMHIEDLSDPDYVPPLETYGFTTRKYSGLENNYISVNQLGYYPGLVKRAVLGSNEGDFVLDAPSIKLEGSYDYEIVTASDGTVVYTGKTGEPVKDPCSGDSVCSIDFTAFDTPGEYYLRIKGKEWRSFPFRIGTDIYQESGSGLLTNALNYFYLNRAGTDITADYITSGEKTELQHNKDYDESVGFVQAKRTDYEITRAEFTEENSSSRINTSGGWFTGSGYDKDMTEGGIAVWTLQNMYERAAQSEAGTAKFADGSGAAVVPENGNAYPDILDECRYELDYMAKMKVQSDEETWGEYAGLYYHRIQGVGFRPDMPAYEHEFHAAYAVQPPSFAATLHYAACAAQAARLWVPYDAEYAAELLAGAKEAYQAYKKNWYRPENGEIYRPESLYVRAEYTDNMMMDSIQDEAYWAACELFITAKELDDSDAESYFTDLAVYTDAFGFPQNNSGDGNELLTNQKTAAAGSLSLLLHRDLLSDERAAKLEKEMLAAADSCLAAEEAQGYASAYQWKPDYNLPNGLDYRPLGGYLYNSNGKALNNTIMLAYSYDLTGDAKYLNGVAAGMDYLLGVNPMAYSYITGCGAYHVQNPANRYWKREQDHSLPSAPDGVVVSGPNARVQDNYVRALGMKEVDNWKWEDTFSQRIYADSVESWSTNEATVSCNASLAWVVSFMQDEAASVTLAPDVPGDADGSGKTDISDAVALTKYLFGTGRIKATASADLNQDGKLTAADLTLLKRMLLGL